MDGLSEPWPETMLRSPQQRSSSLFCKKAATAATVLQLLYGPKPEAALSAQQLPSSSPLPDSARRLPEAAEHRHKRGLWVAQEDGRSDQEMRGG